ncbi:serine/threonine-protein kinase [Phormidium sp. CCY1219]|uniref:serine/threonine-protein kinase n=1 Tax=Phormidium sp. CCY1219 TaxID=2886104 RepID=UPI002D1F49F1|nr:serine/threonine-protein kinase [Phormidium sp. CCY1219]MEB3830705.1 serine/threonine protein kinase [Phormidium sp. CCY1219]
MNPTHLSSDRASLHPLKPQLSKYRILQLVGQGQFGKVFCATERKTEQLVALKELTHQRLTTHKFLQELWSLLTLQHPNIVTCRALEQTPTARYFVMDYCEGSTLRELLERQNSLTLAEGLHLMRCILAGLDCAHRQSIVHCDLKPENILLTLKNGEWFARLSDFGIARRFSQFQSQRPRSDAMEAIGAIAYTAPEGFYGLYSPSADLYSMGILLFEILLGDRPFSGNPTQLMWAHLNQRLSLPPWMPAALRHIIAKALEKLPARRYKTATTMAQAIAQALQDPQVQSLSTRLLPLGEHPPTAEAPTLTLTPTQTSRIESSPTKDFALTATAEVLYTASDRHLQIQPADNPQTKQLNFPEAIAAILPGAKNCTIATQHHIYAISPEADQCQPLLTLNPPFHAAIDPQNRWLAVARPRHLAFYSLTHQAPLKPDAPTHACALPAPRLPQILFLDPRHLLAIWTDPHPKKQRTLLQVYARRGMRVASVQLQLKLDRLMLAGQPYTLFGIAHHPLPAAWRIQLFPLQVTRIPLSTPPACWSAVPGGIILAHAGEILCLDEEGNPLGSWQGVPEPVALAAGFQGGTLTPGDSMKLAIATRTDAGGAALHYFEVNVKKNP